MSDTTKVSTNFISILLGTLNIWLWVLFVVSICVVFVMDMWLLDIPAPYKFFEAMGKFNYGVSVSYIAAFIFYLISVHYPDTKSAISQYTAARFPAKAIVTNIEGIFLDMGKQLGKDIDKKSLNDESIKEILVNTKCYSKSTLVDRNSLGNGTLSYFTWMQVIKNRDLYVRELFKQLHPLYTKLDGEYIKTLSEIEQDNSLYAVLSMVSVTIQLGKITQKDACFDNGLENIMLQLYHKVEALDKIITDRDESYGLDR